MKNPAKNPDALSNASPHQDAIRLRCILAAQYAIAAPTAPQATVKRNKKTRAGMRNAPLGSMGRF
jgi:hypothetical protein